MNITLSLFVSLCRGLMMITMKQWVSVSSLLLASILINLIQCYFYSRMECAQQHQHCLTWLTGESVRSSSSSLYLSVDSELRASRCLWVTTPPEGFKTSERLQHKSVS